MNVPVIASQLVDAVRTISPTADIQAEVDLLTQHVDGTIRVAIHYIDALKLIDFINDHQKPQVENPDQLTLF